VMSQVTRGGNDQKQGGLKAFLVREECKAGEKRLKNPCSEAVLIDPAYPDGYLRGNTESRVGHCQVFKMDYHRSRLARVGPFHGRLNPVLPTIPANNRFNSENKSFQYPCVIGFHGWNHYFKMSTKVFSSTWRKAIPNSTEKNPSHFNDTKMTYIHKPGP